jgi:ribonuclease D
MNNPISPIPLKHISFSGRIHLIKSDEEMRAVVEVLKSAKELGFDTETKPSFRKGEVFKVAMLQLSTETEAFVIRLHYLTDFEVLKSIFENKEVLKVGVAIRDDLKQLQKVFKFEPQNFIELQAVAKAKGLKNFGLKTMSEEVLQATISKGPKMTNWEAQVLTDQQITYAATDAWIGLILFNKIKSQSP